VRHSTDRILVSHAGNLPRPDDVNTLLANKDSTGFSRRLPTAVNDIVDRQVELGVDIVNDGEYVKAGSYTAFCAIAGHQQAGMQATLVIGGSGSATGAAAGMANMDFNSMTPQQLAAMNDQMDATMAKPVKLYVSQLETGPNTKGVGNQHLAPQVLSDGTKVEGDEIFVAHVHQTPTGDD
jgi:hypothetical protein